MTRPALRLAPTFGVVNDTQDAYVFPNQLRPLAKQYGRYWSFHSLPTTVALPGNRFAKSLKGFTAHQEEGQFRELLREYSENGVPRPSSYADVFHERFFSPRVPFSINAILAPAFAGGWQAVLHPFQSVFRGTYRKYDMRSAYLWAATLGLPDSASYQRSLRPNKTGKDGVYRIQLIAPTPGAPFPFNTAMECLASNLEIETYGLKVRRVLDGVTWDRLLSADKLLEAIKSTSTWKLAGRGYWGRWMQTQRIECAAVSGTNPDGSLRLKKWYIPNLALNIPLAHMIVSRVKMRLWEHSVNAVHVYVDSVITPNVLPTGDNLGDWRLETVYKNGVKILRPGQYGDIDAIQMERMSGVPKDSLERYLV